MDTPSAEQGLSALAARLSELADPAGCWTIRSDEVIRLVGADPVRFWREMNGLRHRICFGEAIDGFTQDTVGDLVTVLEHVVGDGAEEALRRSGLFMPHGPGVELTEQLLHAAHRFSAVHGIDADEFLAMVRHAGSVRGAIGIYLGEHADVEGLIDSCAQSFRAMHGLPGIGTSTAARYLRRMFDRHVLDRRGLFTLLEERLRLAAAKAGHVDPEDRVRDEGEREGREREGGANRGGRVGAPAARGSPGLGSAGAGVRRQRRARRRRPARPLPAADDAPPPRRGPVGSRTLQGRECRLCPADRGNRRRPLKPLSGGAMLSSSNAAVHDLTDTYTMCIVMCMRTNIDLPDKLLTEAGRFARGRTKKAIVEEALKAFIESRSLEARRRSYGERLRALESRTASLSLRKSPAELLRADRERT